ncbi:MAG: hypothetical protein WBA74_09890 [Cyclobacteriaceae bacterium]
MINTSIANGIIAESVRQNMNSSEENNEIRELFNKVLTEKGIDSADNIKWIDNQNIEVNDLPPSALHTFLLEAEKLGKKIGFEKKTIIKIA